MHYCPCVLTPISPQEDTDDGKVSRKPTDKSAEQKITAKQLVKSVLADPRPAAKAWDSALTKNTIDPDVLKDAVSILHMDARYDFAIEAIQSGIRNGLAAAWMYDVLAMEMKLAKRPEHEIARVLESRIDFANADVSQLLISAALLSRFDAFDEAIRVCREATDLSPGAKESWLMARSIADKSGKAEHRVWARCGILMNVWDDDSTSLHEEARNVIAEIATKLDAAGDSTQAEQFREQLREASAIDMILTLRWVGSADLDLLITQPNGEVCNYKNRSTTDGARLVHDDSGSSTDGNAKRYEQYICRVATDGEYKASIRFVLGKAVGGTAILEIVRNSGTESESRTNQTIKLSREDVTVVVTGKVK